GLSDWRGEALALAAHAQYLLRHCWKSQLTLSLPRLRPCAGSFKPTSPFTDRHLAQLICALRLYLPDVGLVLSTREPAHLRNGLLPLGITLISAGSHTEPGGYTGAGKDRIHYTQRGRVMELQAEERTRIPDQPGTTPATGQFDISDDRSPAEMASQLRSLGYDPVWKDWDSALTL
ncbi:MAG: 2-iminoacetate synthase ThiH, partial [Verrucomicrobia bacterium]|nr:2-iminoacetate synthase ThiH [Verrucomicrobiota bacterium]